MTLQAKLTIGSVLLATLIVMLVSAVDLGNQMQSQFESTLERAKLIEWVAAQTVKDSLNRPHLSPMGDALRDPALNDRLLDLLGQAPSILEIAAVSAVSKDTRDVLASTTAAH